MAEDTQQNNTDEEKEEMTPEEMEILKEITEANDNLMKEQKAFKIGVDEDLDNLESELDQMDSEYTGAEENMKNIEKEAGDEMGEVALEYLSETEDREEKE